MIPASHPLYEIKQRLEEAIQQGDAAFLADCLAGRHLPASDPSDQPADLIYRALTLPPYKPERLLLACDLLAEQIENHCDALAAGETGTLRHALYAENLLLFAGSLPRDERLFQALKRWYFGEAPAVALANLSSVGPRFLRRALIQHQTDASMEDVWLQTIHSPDQQVAPSEEKILDAWKGLLWIPPNEEERATETDLSTKRIVRGLEALSEATQEQGQDGEELLLYAIRRLDDAYPRSAESWVRRLQPYIPQLPERLVSALSEVWPPVGETRADFPLCDVDIELFEEVAFELAEEEASEVLSDADSEFVEVDSLADSKNIV